MSFLDRFQNKIATVTAQGHLKKADGSEEIRVGPPKKRAQPALDGCVAVKAANRTDNNSPSNQAPPPSGRRPQQGNASHSTPRVANGGRDKQALQPEKNLNLPACQSHVSPDASPRSRTYRAEQDNNSNYHAHQQRGGQYYEQAQLPGRAYEDQEQDYYQSHQRRVSPGKGGTSSPDRCGRQGGAVQNASSPQRSQAADRLKNHSPQAVNRGEQEGPPSPRERNEARVQNDEDQLAFSKKARPVQFAPCTVAQYKKEKPAGYYELGKLQPDLNSDDLVQKRANKERIKAFSKNLRVINKAAAPAPGSDAAIKTTSKKKTESTRDKALAFAKHIPKPRIQQRALAESSGIPSNSSSSENLPTIKRATQPVSSTTEGSILGKEEAEEEDDDDGLSRELRELQMRHQASRAQVEAMVGSP